MTCVNSFGFHLKRRSKAFDPASSWFDCFLVASVSVVLGFQLAKFGFFRSFVERGYGLRFFLFAFSVTFRFAFCLALRFAFRVLFRFVVLVLSFCFRRL